MLICKFPATGLSTDFLSLIATMLSKDPKDRSTAMELLQHPFFNEITHLELPVALEIMKSSSAVVSPANSFNRRSIPPTTPQKPPTLPVANPTMSQSSIFEAQTLSRYRLDFEEIEFLGKGGFGEVVKARNRIGEFPYQGERAIWLFMGFLFVRWAVLCYQEDSVGSEG